MSPHHKLFKSITNLVTDVPVYYLICPKNASMPANTQTTEGRNGVKSDWLNDSGSCDGERNNHKIFAFGLRQKQLLKHTHVGQLHQSVHLKADISQIIKT